ncbi:MAG: NADH:ubiquinone reductase (Na(+)-transporting) subunit D [Candidatus Omnitrophica bacterium]|nr:NADH:ubiquinone reductase (Na(+)-transporting) subunit D [Candidatus Omnitrophota bacterium]
MKKNRKKIKRKLIHTKSFRIIIGGLWRDNPIFCMVLGICSSLAITNRVENAITMGLGVTFVLIFTEVIISSLRNFIPERVRMITYMVVIATFVIVVDRFLKAFFPVISEALGPYVGLIITNCILMGRAEAYAIKNKLKDSLLDSIACGLGYTYILILMSVIREFFGFGTILGRKITSDTWTNWAAMTIAPGAFFLLAIYLWIFRTILKKTEQ